MLKYKELEVYDRKETISIGEFITEQIEVIHDQIAILKGENCLAGLINFYKNDGKIYDDSIKEISDYVNKHKKAGKISIQADLERLTKTLQNFCEENLVIQFISEDDKSQEARLKSSTISREGSSHKTFSQKLVQRGNQV